MIALGQYITLIAIAILSAAVAVDRQRAEWMLFSLMAATAVVALGVLVSEHFVSAGRKRWGHIARANASARLRCARRVFAGATAIRTLERYETRRASPDRSVPLLMGTFACCAVAMVICLAALALNAKATVLVATAYGVGALAAVVFIRRLGLGPWGILAIVLPGVALAVFLIAGNPALGTRSFCLIFATQASDALTSTSQRILADTPSWGIGAGSFSAIVPIYSDIDETTSQPGGSDCGGGSSD